MFHHILTGDTTFPEISTNPPSDFIYKPQYCQFFYSHLNLERERNVGAIAVVEVYKENSHTVFRLTWEGNFRKRGCADCCSRWWIEIDGSQCSDYERIETSITSNSALDIAIPTTLTGYCIKSGNIPLSYGNHQIKVVVGHCPNTRIVNSGSGFFSSSRLIVEEVPTRKKYT